VSEEALILWMVLGDRNASVKIEFVADWVTVFEGEQ
jgi:hypothetical protein